MKTSGLPKAKTEPTLEKLLLKHKKGPTIPVAIRFKREILEGLAEIERETDLPYSSLIKMVVRRVLRHWQKNHSLTLPLYICVMSIQEAQQKGIITDGEDWPEHEKPKRRDQD